MNSRAYVALQNGSIQIPGDAYNANIMYKTHVQSFGWQTWKTNGQMSGTSGKAKRLEGINIKLSNASYSGGVRYTTHVQSYGWQGNENDPNTWKKDGEMSGTSGQAKRLEGIEIKLVPKSQIVDMGVQYRVHCQTYGWMSWLTDGKTSGTTGEGKRLEAIQIIVEPGYGVGVEYRTHIQSKGWEKTWKKDGETSGTSGEAKRLEAIQIRLTGTNKNKYDIYYRVQAQTYGWLGWAKNGSIAGTSGLAKRLEAIQIVIIPKGEHAPNPLPAAPGAAAYVH